LKIYEAASIPPKITQIIIALNDKNPILTLSPTIINIDYIIGIAIIIP
jgi:hypothetical protein